MVIREIISVVLYEDFGTIYPLHKSARKSCGLVLTLPGTDVVLCRAGRKYRCGEGTANFYPQGDRYDVFLPNNHLKCLVFDFFADGADDFFLAHNCGDLTASFFEAHRLWLRHREDEHFRYDCMGILYRLLAEIRRRADRSGAPYRLQARLSPMLEILHSEYRNHDFRISELAERTGYSERYIGRLFSDILGRSPKQYLTDLRFGCAKELLGGGLFSITEVAERSGFGDSCRFSQEFRRMYGMTPGEYRRTQVNPTPPAPAKEVRPSRKSPS